MKQTYSVHCIMHSLPSNRNRKAKHLGRAASSQCVQGSRNTGQCRSDVSAFALPMFPHHLLQQIACVALPELKPHTSITSVLLSSPLRYSWISAGSQMQSTNQGTSLLSLHLFRFRGEEVCLSIFSNLLHLLLPGVVLIAVTFSTSRA